MHKSLASLMRASVRRSRAPLAIGLAAMLSGCDMDSLVRANDPDVIAPGFINNAAGANAIRVGTLGRMNAATTGTTGGDETIFMLGGLLADEFTAGDTFLQRNETDSRSLTYENAVVNTIYRQMHRVRIGAVQAREALEQYAPQSPAWQRAEMYLVEAYMITLIAEHFCNGQPLSYIKDGQELYGEPQSAAELYAKAQQLIDSGAALVAGTSTAANDVRVRNSLAVLKGRVLLNQGDFQNVVAATQNVPTSFVWNQEHSPANRTPVVWEFVNSQRRFIVSDNEGPLGLDLVSGNDPRVPACVAGEAECTAAGWTEKRPFDSGNLAVPDMRYQLVYKTNSDNVPLFSGLQARLYEAEAHNRNGNFGAALTILNNLRASAPTYRSVPAMAPLTDPGTAEGRRDLIFREKAFWLFGTGHRYPDMRRMVRQYSMPQDQVFPTGTWQNNRTPGYGDDIFFLTPQSETKNPNMPRDPATGAPQCLDMNA